MFGAGVGGAGGGRGGAVKITFIAGRAVKAFAFSRFSIGRAATGAGAGAGLTNGSDIFIERIANTLERVAAG